MDKGTYKIFDGYFGRIADESRNRLAKDDERYQFDCAQEQSLELQCSELDLGENEKMLISDHIAYLKSCGSRYADISYLAGVQDTIRFLRSLDLIKGIEETEE